MSIISVKNFCISEFNNYNFSSKKYCPIRFLHFWPGCCLHSILNVLLHVLLLVLRYYL